MTIQRVFVLFRRSDRIIAEQAVDIVLRHWSLSQRLRTTTGAYVYEVRAIPESKYEEEAPSLADSTRHFGVFHTSTPEELPLAFDVDSDDLTRLNVMSVNRTSKFVRDFDRLWQACGPLTEIGLRYMLRAEMLRRIESGSYSALSTFASWTDSSLNEFHRECLEAATKRGVAIRRIFIASPGDSVEDVFTFLKKYQDESRGIPHHEWNLCNLQDVPERLRRQIPPPYGILEDHGRQRAQHVMYEAFSSDVSQPVYLSGPSAADMFEAFMEFWARLSAHRRNDIRARFGTRAAELLR